jgi:fatty acid desaturase
VFVNSVIAYAFYTVHHDGTHKAISGRSSTWRWLDAGCGAVAAVALQLDHRGYSGVHLRHHAFTNRDGDPDVVLKGSLWQLPVKWLIGTVLGVIALLPFGAKLVAPIERLLGGDGEPPADERRRRDSARMRRWQQGCFLVMFATIPFGSFWDAFWLWFVASQIGIFYLVVLFQWLPHFPFERQDRFGATRVNRFPGSSMLLLMQDHHLIHHLYPTVPWYRYRAVFRELRPYLEQHDAIIQGSDTTPHLPIQLRAGASAAG